MKRTKQKGSTLVEVLVSILVFMVISMGLITSYLGMRKLVRRQEENLQFEMICREIAIYGDMYGKAWVNNYFMGVTPNPHLDGDIVYYNSDFEPVSEESRYILNYQYTPDDKLIVSIRERETGRYIIEELDYGGARYVTKTETE